MFARGSFGKIGILVFTAKPKRLSAFDCFHGGLASAVLLHGCLVGCLSHEGFILLQSGCLTV